MPAPRFARAALLAAVALAGCDDDGPVREADARCVVSFDGYVYVDASASTAAVLERVQHQQQSITSSLRRRRIGVDGKRPGVDVRTLTREPVHLVSRQGVGSAARSGDADGGSSMVRVRYRFRSLGRAPKSEAHADLTVAAIQNDGAGLDGVTNQCVPQAERGATAGTPWKSFDATLPSCVAAVSAEQRRLTGLRKSLPSAADVTGAEVDRHYLPIGVRVRPRRPKGPKAAPLPKARSSAGADQRDEPKPEPAPSASAGAEPLAELDPLAEAIGVDDGYDDAPDDPGAAADGAGDGDPSGAPDRIGSKWLEPNYYLLGLVGVALLVLLRGKRRR